MLWTATTFKYTFDYHPEDIYFCTADIGWITGNERAVPRHMLTAVGHSYITYGPMLNAATRYPCCISVKPPACQAAFAVQPANPTPQRVVRGRANPSRCRPPLGNCGQVPRHPVLHRYLRIALRKQLSQPASHPLTNISAPTAIRALQRFGAELPAKYNLSSLRILGSVGEPINPEAWLWYVRVPQQGKSTGVFKLVFYYFRHSFIPSAQNISLSELGTTRPLDTNAAPLWTHGGKRRRVGTC